MNILFLSHKFYPDVGGIEVNSEILANAFHQAGHRVRLLTWSHQAGREQFPYKIRRNPGLVSLLREHLWADIVYENNPCLRLAWPSLFFHKRGVVALCTWIGTENGKTRWQDRFKMRWLKRARSVIAVSESVRQKCWPAATVISNPYRADIFKTKPAFKRKNSFVFLGRLVSDKGADLAIMAMRLLSDAIPQAESLTLTIIGDGPDRRELEELVLHLGISNHVKFSGVLRGESLVSCLNNHKYLLVPSVWEEPFGNVALEGMACGCIPIVSDGGGLPDAVGKAGLVFPRGDVAALTECILDLLRNPMMEEALREAAPAHLAAHRPEVIARKYLEVISNANH
ncbi:MAG: glycosyltransferase family 4 protein [Chryseosolibacter sp.]